jgi:AraC-like DNA-binding protein
MEEENEERMRALIEEALMEVMRVGSEKTDYHNDLFEAFLGAAHSRVEIGDFCATAGISTRQLERLFERYIGVSPKSFARLTRFQKVSQRLIQNDFDRLVDLALEHEYYDQMHFVKECKSFAGVTPSRLSERNISVKSIMEFT